ncbi:MAG TPA: YnfA family protein [Candidatus Kapabacteria bacterium]|nr:YnfA family protein [Candidatus Kapabacteria bacterium]
MFTTTLLFIFAAIFEIGGGYLIWLYVRDNKPWWYGVMGAVALIGYGVVATFQNNNFARVYATYGGVFIAMSLLRGIVIDNYCPDRYDMIGCFIALLGVAIIYFAPR